MNQNHQIHKNKKNNLKKQNPNKIKKKKKIYPKRVKNPKTQEGGSSKRLPFGISIGEPEARGTSIADHDAHLQHIINYHIYFSLFQILFLLFLFFSIFAVQKYREGGREAW